MIDSRVFWSLFHLFILSFFLSGTVFHVEKIELNSFFNKKAKSLPSNFWITVFLIFLTLFISILILITQGEMSSRWIATWSFSNIIYCVIGSSFCLIVFLFFLNTFHGDLSIRFIDKTILFLTSSIGLFGYAFLVYSISISFDFTQLGGYQQIVSFWSMSLIFILGVIFYTTCSKSSIFFHSRNSFPYTQHKPNFHNSNRKSTHTFCSTHSIVFMAWPWKKAVRRPQRVFKN